MQAFPAQRGNLEKKFYNASHEFVQSKRRDTLTFKLKIICIITLLLALNFTSIQFVQSAPNDIQIVSYSYYTVSVVGTEVLGVVGEIKNVGTNTIDSVQLAGTVYDAAGTEQGDSSCEVLVSQIVPQQSTPFYMEFKAPTNAQYSWSALGNLKVTFSVEQAEATGNYQYPDLRIQSSTGSVSTISDDKGTYWVRGSIKNVGNKDATRYWVVATFYNSSGSVVAFGFSTYLEPRTLSPSATADFKVGAYDTNQSSAPSSQKISSYSIVVQTKEPILQGTAPTAQATHSSTTVPTTNEDEKPDLNITNIIIAVVAIIIVALALLVVSSRRQKRYSTKNSSVNSNKPSKNSKEPL